MPAVVYTTEDGWKQVRIVPKRASARDYGKGVLVGPPDLLELQTIGLSVEEIRQINNALVEAGIVNYESLKGNRGMLVSILREIVGQENVSSVRNYILYIFERERFPDNFGE